jgi:DNA-binding FadR family transcriptional regulator
VAQPSFDRMVEQMGEQMGETMTHMLKNSAKSLDHLREARATFEMQMAAIASRKHVATDIEDLKVILKNQASVGMDSPEFLDWDGQFHHRIAEISGNPIFATLSQSLFDWLAQFNFNLVRKPGLEKLTLTERWQFLEAIESGNAERAYTGKLGENWKTPERARKT